MHRFFIPPHWIDEDKVIIRGDQAHQLYHVLRSKLGDRIVVLDNSGWEYEVQLQHLSKEAVEGRILVCRPSSLIPKYNLTLFQAVLKGNKFDFILQKGTEIGITDFVPILCQRCIVTESEPVNSRKMQRWQKIIREAAEQCRLGKLPQIHPTLSFEQACQKAVGFSLIPWEEEKSTSLRSLLHSDIFLQQITGPPKINVFIGPEGGFSREEVDLSRSYGIIPVTLGSRILRAETAGLVAATIVLYELGELGDGL